MPGRSSLVTLVGFAALWVAATAQQPAPAQALTFVGAEACRPCHDAYYDAWATTKHARALSRLSSQERAGGACIRCHVTGTPEMIAAEGSTPSFPNVQCEACHGAGSAHVAAARQENPGAARTATIEERTCTRCHNEDSPYYKTFIYRALIGLVHRTG